MWTNINEVGRPPQGQFRLIGEDACVPGKMWVDGNTGFDAAVKRIPILVSHGMRTAILDSEGRNVQI